MNYTVRQTLPNTTYGALEAISSEIKARAKKIKQIILAAHKVGDKDYRTSVLLLADGGSVLFEASLLSISRLQREIEVIELFERIKACGLLKDTCYVTSLHPVSCDLPAIEAAEEMFAAKQTLIKDDWVSFCQLYFENGQSIEASYFSQDDWEKLA